MREEIIWCGSPTHCRAIVMALLDQFPSYLFRVEDLTGEEAEVRFVPTTETEHRVYKRQSLMIENFARGFGRALKRYKIC